MVSLKAVMAYFYSFIYSTVQSFFSFTPWFDFDLDVFVLSKFIF